MKKYIVEMRKDYNDDFDNWIGDYVEAEDEVEAEEFAKQWLIDNGMEPDEAEELEYKVSFHSTSIKDKRIEVGLNQKEFSDLFEIPIDVVKSWDCGRRYPARWAEKLIIEKLNNIAETTSQ